MLLCEASGACCNSTITEISFDVFVSTFCAILFSPHCSIFAFNCGLNCFSFCSDSAWALNAPKLEKTSAILNSVDVVFFIETPPDKKCQFSENKYYIFIVNYRNGCWLNYTFDIIHTKPL